MSVRYIELGCDIPRCSAMCRVERTELDEVRTRAANRWGWSTTSGGDDMCGPCTRGDTPDSRGEGT